MQGRDPLRPIEPSWTFTGVLHPVVGAAVHPLEAEKVGPGGDGLAQAGGGDAVLFELRGPVADADAVLGIRGIGALGDFLALEVAVPFGVAAGRWVDLSLGVLALFAAVRAARKMPSVGASPEEGSAPSPVQEGRHRRRLDDAREPPMDLREVLRGPVAPRWGDPEGMDPSFVRMWTAGRILRVQQLWGRVTAGAEGGPLPDVQRGVLRRRLADQEGSIPGELARELVRRRPSASPWDPP